MFTTLYFLRTYTLHGPDTQTLVPQTTHYEVHLQLVCADKFGKLVVWEVHNVLLRKICWRVLGRDIITLCLRINHVCRVSSKMGQRSDALSSFFELGKSFAFSRCWWVW